MPFFVQNMVAFFVNRSIPSTAQTSELTVLKRFSESYVSLSSDFSLNLNVFPTVFLQGFPEQWVKGSVPQFAKT